MKKNKKTLSLTWINYFVLLKFCPKTDTFEKQILDSQELYKHVVKYLEKLRSDNK